MPDLVLHAAHLGNPAGIVGDRAVGVERHDHAGERQHRRRRKGNADEAREQVGGDDRDADHDRRHGGGFKADRQTLDHVGAMAGLRGLGDALHRAEVGAGVVFGNPHQQAGDRQADQHAPEQVPAGEAAGLLCDRSGHVHASRLGSTDDRVHVAQRELCGEIKRRDRKRRRGPEALVERAHDRLAAAEPDHVGADDRGDDAHAADQQRQGHERGQLLGRGGDEQGGQHHRRADGHDIGLEQIGGHAGAVADIVADVVGDHRRVAGIVLRNTGLDLADEVGADVRRLGEDAAAQTREDGDERGAERQGDQRVNDRAVIRRAALNANKNVEEHRDRQQRQTRHQHAGDGAGAEGRGEAALQARAGGFGGADVGAHRDVHADIAGHARQDGSGHEANGGDWSQEEEDEHGDDHADDADGGVLPAEIGLRALLDGGGDVDHPLITGGCL